jgi:hypothetical protein
MDGMELRGWSSQAPMVPSRDLTDALGNALLSTIQAGELSPLKTYVAARRAVLGTAEAVASELYEGRWGPTGIPIYNVILPFFVVSPGNKQHLLDLTRYLALEVRVPVDGTDVTGASALYWAIATKPHAEPEFAQLLFDAGGSVNQRNRFGGTAAAEIAQVDFSGDTGQNERMLAWYIEHGGDVDGKDNDGMTVLMLVEMMRGKVPGMAEVLAKGRGPRGEGDCANCGRRKSGEKAFAACAKCKSVRYCSQDCQKVDWRTHKKSCKAKS